MDSNQIEKALHASNALLIALAKGQQVPSTELVMQVGRNTCVLNSTDLEEDTVRSREMAS